jgi:hypothetical protein
MKRNTPIHRSVVTVLCVLSLSPGLVFAGGRPKPGEERGIIKSVDMSAHTLVITERKKNADQKFQWNDQTKFKERDKRASANDLKEGERVHLSYIPGGGMPVLQSVRIAAARTAKHNANDLSLIRNNDA